MAEESTKDLEGIEDLEAVTKKDIMEGLNVIDSWGDDDEASKRGRKSYDVKTYINKYKMVRKKFYETGESSPNKKDLKDNANPKDDKLFMLDDFDLSDDLSEILHDAQNPQSSKDNEKILSIKSAKYKPLHYQGSHFNNFRGCGRYVYSPRRSPVRTRPVACSPRHHSPHRSSRHRSRSLQRNTFTRRNRSPYRSPTCTSRSMRRSRSPRRSRSHHRSPARLHRKHRTHRFSSEHSPLPCRSITPKQRSHDRSRRLRSPTPKNNSPHKDSFLYPSSTFEYEPPPPGFGSVPLYSQVPEHQPYAAPPYSYSVQQSGPAYSMNYPAPYNYNLPAVPGSEMPSYPPPVPVPAPVSESKPLSVPAASAQIQMEAPYDALAKLVADGKLSKQDYLKLAPNKARSAVSLPLDVKEKVQLLTRCNEALSKLSKLQLPNHMIVLNHKKTEEPIQPTLPKYCSPLKRQTAVYFQFTNPTGGTTSLQNRLLLDSIISAIGVDAVDRVMPTVKVDAGVQTRKPFCQECEIRNSICYVESATSIDAEHFSTSVQTQVIEKELEISRPVLDSTISLSHMTPAQLVSQLAARAKSLHAADGDFQNSGVYRQGNAGSGYYGANKFNSNYRY